MTKKRKVVFWIAIVVMIGALISIVVPLTRQKKNAAVYQELPEIVGSYGPKIDFDELKAVNEDIYAWIEIPGMDIAYPIVQHPTDNSYYLNYTIEGNFGMPASIYTEVTANTKDFTDFNTVIYGHNAGEGQMFSNLLNYVDESVLEKNREIIIYTPQKEYHYTIFAAVIFSDAYLPVMYPGDTTENRQAYLDDLKNVHDINSHFLSDIEVSTEDKLITLSTCPDSFRQEPRRYLVAAKLTEVKDA